MAGPSRRRVAAASLASIAIMAFNVLPSLLGAATMSIADYGVLMTLMAVCTVAERIASFQSVNSVAYFGGRCLAAKASPAPILRKSFVLDSVAIVVGCGIAVAASKIVGIESGAGSIVAVCLEVLALSVGTSVGALRLLDRHGMLGVAYTMGAAGRIAVLFAFVNRGAGPAEVFAGFVMVDLACASLLLAFALLSTRQEARVQRLSSTWDDLPRFNAFLRYAWHLNITGSLRLIVRELDVVAVATFFGTTAAGSLRLAKALALPPLSAVELVYQALPSWFTRMLHGGEGAKVRSVSQVGGRLAAGAVVAYGVLLWAFFPALVAHFGKTELIVSLSLALLYLPGVVFQALTVGYLPILTATGRARESARIMAVSALAYCFIAVPGLLTKSMLVVTVAFPMHYLVWSVLMERAVAAALHDHELTQLRAT